MPQAWITLAGDDLWKVISRPVLEKANEDAEGGTVELNDFNAALDSRATESVRIATAMVRAAIENGNRSPLSLVATEVPPEAERHVLNIAAFDLTSSPPSLQQVLIFEGGVYSPRQLLFKQATDWLDKVRSGDIVVITPTNPDPANTPKPIRWGDYSGTSAAGTAGKYDLTTDGPWTDQ